MRALPVAALTAITLLILAVTLQPDPSQAGSVWLLCVFCGERATADVIANIILFVPFGAALAWLAPQARGAWRLGLALSLGIELAQRFLAGRDASIGDVMTNTLGTVLGLALWRYATGGARRPSPAAWPLAALGFVGVVAITTWLLRPAATAETYYAMWTPLLGHVEWYRGRVLDAHLGGATFRPGRLADPAPVRAFVHDSGSLAVRFIAARSTMAVAPLVAVYDGARHEILLLGPDRQAVVLRYRHRAADWALDEPDMRFERAATTWKPGDTLALTVTRTSGGACLSAPGTAPACLPDATPGRAWSLVLYPEGLAPVTRAALDVMWIAGFALLVGWCAGTVAAGAAAGVVVLLSLIGAPLAGGFAAPAGELAGACAGIVAGVSLRRVARRAGARG